MKQFSSRMSIQIGKCPWTAPEVWGMVNSLSSRMRSTSIYSASYVFTKIILQILFPAWSSLCVSELLVIKFTRLAETTEIKNVVTNAYILVLHIKSRIKKIFVSRENFVDGKFATWKENQNMLT